MPFSHAIPSCHLVMTLTLPCRPQSVKPFSQALQSCHSIMPFSHGMQSCHAVMPCSHAMQSCRAVMPCSHAVQTCHSVMRCSHAVQSCHAVMPFSHAIRSSGSFDDSKAQIDIQPLHLMAGFQHKELNNMNSLFEYDPSNKVILVCLARYKNMYSIMQVAFSSWGVEELCKGRNCFSDHNR